MAKQIEFSIDFKDETHLPSPSSTPYVYFPANLQIDDLKKKFITETIDCLKIIYSCLVCYQNGDLHMFKPIAVQLRMLFCDSNRKKDNSLFTRISTDIKLLAFCKIEWRSKRSEGLHISFSEAPFFVTKRVGGIQIADIDISQPPKYLPLEEWLGQIVDLTPMPLNVKHIIRAVADKGGGAHIDNSDGEELSAMKRNAPDGVGGNIYFIIALARYTLKVGKQFIRYWEKELNEKLF